MDGHDAAQQQGGTDYQALIFAYARSPDQDAPNAARHPVGRGPAPGRWASPPR